VTRDRLKALTKLASGLHTKCVKLFGQEFPGVADIAVNEINTHPEELLLEIILNQISLRLGQSAARRLFAKFGPEPRRGQARHRRHFLAALYGSKGRPPKQRFAREAAEFNRRTKQRLSRETREFNRRGMSPKSQERIVRYDALLGSGATQTKSMLQYVNRMLRDKECQKIVEGAQANGLLDG
jgi:hypothetical protein